MSRVEERLAIAADGTIVARSGKVELGQGIRTAFARLVATELGIPPAGVRVELGDTATTPWDMGTFGSLSVRTEGATLARSAAVLRGLLIARAARRWGIDAAHLRAGDGFVRAPDGRSASYAELAAGEPLVGDVPDATPIARQDPDIAAPDDRRALVTGAETFVGDLRVPGMLRGTVVQPPAYGARIATIDIRAALAVPGVVEVVHDGDFVGVVAEHSRQARAGASALAIEWAAPPPVPPVERTLVMRSDPGVESALATAPSSIDLDYELPHVANAPLGTTAALAEVHANEVTIVATTQAPFRVRDQAAQLLGVPAARVRVIAGRGAGSFGRNNQCDAAVEAVRLSRAVGRPVLVEWNRTDELRAAPNRPMLRAIVRAGCERDGTLVAWSSAITTNPHVYFGELARLPEEMLAMTCARNAVPPYRVPAARVEVRVVPAAIRTAALRSLSAAPNVFAIESAIDELAELAGIDPLEMRLRNCSDPRLARVLDAAAALAHWGTRPLGLACAIYNGTYIAQVAEVEVTGGKLRVPRAWCAVDCGTLVDRDGARNQLEGAVVHATSWALFEELSHADGRVLARNWDDYPVARFGDAPAVEIVFTDDGVTAPTGLGEPGVVPFGAAIANALAATIDRRVRTQPIRI